MLVLQNAGASAGPRLIAEVRGEGLRTAGRKTANLHLRLDLNTASWEGGRARIARAHLLSSAVLLETDSDKPHVFSVGRAALDVNWYSPMQERAMFPATENADTVFLVSAHYLHALEASTGRRAMMFVGGGLGGLRRPALQIPFAPTGSAAAQNDTVYLSGLGSAENNKTLESFSLVTGSRGWGYRTAGDILTSPIVGGAWGIRNSTS